MQTHNSHTLNGLFYVSLEFCFVVPYHISHSCTRAPRHVLVSKHFNSIHSTHHVCATHFDFVSPLFFFTIHTLIRIKRKYTNGNGAFFLKKKYMNHQYFFFTTWTTLFFSSFLPFRFCFCSCCFCFILFPKFQWRWVNFSR